MTNISIRTFSKLRRGILVALPGARLIDSRPLGCSLEAPERAANADSVAQYYKIAAQSLVQDKLRIGAANEHVWREWFSMAHMCTAARGAGKNGIAFYRRDKIA